MPLEKLSDSDLEAIAAGRIDKVSDEGLETIANHDAGPTIRTYDPMESLSDAMRGVGQGLTVGHLPQVEGAVRSMSISGPSYEAAKAKSRADFAAAYERNAPLVFGGELVGSAALPFGVAAEGGGIVRGAATGALTGFAQNPGGDVTLDQIYDRLKNAGRGAAFGGALGKLGTSAESMAERRAFKSLGPAKRDVELARERGTLQSTGRALLDEGIIDNVPVSRETMLERVVNAKERAGQAKSAIIDELSQLEQQYLAQFGKQPQTPSTLPTSTASVPVTTNPTPPMINAPAQGGVDIKAIRDHLREVLALNPDHPEASKLAERIDSFVQGIADGANTLPLKRADKLKTDTGVHVNWIRRNATGLEPERQRFNKELYRALNQGVDDAAEVLAKAYKPELQPQLENAKKLYGQMSTSAGILDKRISGDFANRMISPTDYGAGGIAAIGSIAQGASAAKTAGVSVAAAALNQFLRKYGNQLSAKQLDNLSKLLQSKAIFNSAIGGFTGGIGALERSGDARNARLKALEE